MNIEIYMRNLNGAWDLERESDKKVISTTVANGGYALALGQEDYFGRLVFLYGISKYKVEALPQ